MRLGVYVGSFNPPHLGHINLVNYLIDNGYVDKVLIIPTLDYWDKVGLVDIKHRINMLKFFESDKIIIDNEHNSYPYTYLLMRALTEDYQDELYLIIGADNIINFDKWKNYQELLNYKIIIMNRDNIDIGKYTEKYHSNNFIVASGYESIGVSSSEIRENLNSKYLDKKVLRYIKKNHLYGE
jgi:nicotinate-nucleotide adenylyltransferase